MTLRKLHGKFRDPLIAGKGFSGRMGNDLGEIEQVWITLLMERKMVRS